MLPDVISEDEAQALLAPHLSKLAEVCAAGLPSWEALPPEQTMKQSKLSRATWISAAMAAKARELFDREPGVDVCEKRGFLTLTFGGRLVVRFKKFSGRNLRTSGIQTLQRQAFESQQLSLDGMTVTTLVAGYLLDKLEQEYARLAIVCPFNGDNLWEINLQIPGAGDATVVPIGPKPTPLPAVVVESAHKKKTSEEQE
ncbi:hypothetical protein [Amycolatopsis thermoflava]|uniref:hypothetical protein n=1 Tax=Amycolatopsis thermoflava TaxID=84480 RepID=UPI003D73BC60